MSPVQGKDGAGAIPLGQHQVGGVGHPDLLVVVLGHDRSRLLKLWPAEVSQLPRPTRELVEHCKLGIDAVPGSNEIVELGNDVGRTISRSRVSPIALLTAALSGSEASK